MPYPHWGSREWRNKGENPQTLTLTNQLQCARARRSAHRTPDRQQKALKRPRRPREVATMPHDGSRGGVRQTPNRRRGWPRTRRCWHRGWGTADGDDLPARVAQNVHPEPVIRLPSAFVLKLSKRCIIKQMINRSLHLHMLPTAPEC